MPINRLTPVLRAHKKPTVVVGVPAYNEAKTIAGVIEHACKWADFVVVCDDGSNDRTAEIAEKLGAIVVKHSKNLGYGAAIQSIFKQARNLDADALVTIDADGQHSFGDISRLLRCIQSLKADVVTGSRFIIGGNKVPIYRLLGIRIITFLTNLASQYCVTDAQNGFRAYNKKALESLLLSENGMGVSVEVLVQARQQGLTVVEVPVLCQYREVDQPSTLNPLTHGASVILSLSKLVVKQRPLIFFGLLSMLSLMFLVILWI